MPANDERTYMISGEDDHGDQHMFITLDRDRAVARYRIMVETFGTVRGNEAVERFVLPLTRS